MFHERNEKGWSMMKKLTAKQADFIDNKEKEGLIRFRNTHEEVDFLMRVPVSWLWNHAETVECM